MIESGPTKPESDRGKGLASDGKGSIRVLHWWQPAAPTTEDKMPKLTDTQLIILSGAAKRDDGSVLPLPKKLKLDGDIIAGIFKDLLKKKLVAEQPASPGSPVWREG